LLEGAQVFLGLALQADHGEDRDREPETRRVEIGVVSADDPGFLQGADAAQARRGGKSHATGQLDVGHPALRVQVREQSPVDAVERYHPGPPPLKLLAVKHGIPEILLCMAAIVPLCNAGSRRRFPSAGTRYGQAAPPAPALASGA